MKKKQQPALTITEMLAIHNQSIKLLHKQIIGLYILFAIFWIYVIVETLIEVAGLIEK